MTETMAQAARGAMSLADTFAQAVEHQQAGRPDDAARVLRMILAHVPEHPETLYFLGLVESEQKQFAAAAAHIERAIALSPGNKLFTHHLYEIYRRLGRYDDALAAAHRAIEAHPGDAMMRANLAAIHRDILDLDTAIACAEQAVDMQPDLAEAHFALAESLLLRGDLRRGFREYEWRWGIATAGRLMTPTELPHWDGGEMTRGRLLLVADQGFGDIVMFARFLPAVMERCADVAMVCAPELHRIIAQIAPGIALFDRWAAPPADAYCPLSSLAHRFEVTLETIPAPIPYLVAAPMPIVTPAGHLRIGIAWAGAPEHHNDRNRSMSLAALAPLAALDGVTLVSLQKGAARSEIYGYGGRAPMLDAGRRLRDFRQTAAVIAGLDLVISVDTSVVHLAGAMGKPVWLLLPHAPDWRWLLGRDDSPWYPTVTLIRQATPGDWQGVVAKVAQAVAHLVHEPG